MMRCQRASLDREQARRCPYMAARESGSRSLKQHREKKTDPWEVRYENLWFGDRHWDRFLISVLCLAVFWFLLITVFHNDEKKKKFNNNKESQDYLNKLEIYNSFETEYILWSDQNKNCTFGCFTVWDVTLLMGSKWRFDS